MFVGVPIDCTGRFIGVERMPAALRAAGLVQRLSARDVGDLAVSITDSRRDSTTGIIGFQSVCTASAEIRAGVGRLLRRAERPLVVGGCCTLLIGVFAALRDHVGQVGLAFVDGHLDFYDGRSSPTGEAADMDLAILVGYGPLGLVDLVVSRPLVDPKNVAVIGYRDAETAAAHGSLDPAVVTPTMKFYDSKTVRRRGAASVGNEVERGFAMGVGRFWLHLDFDVLDGKVMPAVDYPQPDGLEWDELRQLVGPLSKSTGLVGADITIYNPTRDKDGESARRIVEFLGDLFTS